MEIKLSDRIPIDRIIRAWKDEFGLSRTSETGVSYIVIKTSIENLRILARTMMDSGYTFEELDDYRTSVKIADICWRDDKIIKMSMSAIQKAKISLTNDWHQVISAKEFSGIEMSKVDPKIESKAEPTKKSKPIEIEPKNRIKMDTSDMAEVPFDDEILAELAAIGTFLKEEDE